MNRKDDENQLRVALYLRVSTEDQVEKYGLDAQRTAIEGIIKSKGKLKDGRDAVVLAGKDFEYVDEGVSGTKEIDERPAFTRLKEDILHAPEGQKPFDVVAVFKIDRFARKLRILMDVLNFFEEKDIEFISATESIDTSTPFGRAMLGIMGVIAELELETIRERTQRGREQAILEGVFMGGHTPYGYNKDENGRLVLFPQEAEVVKKIYNLLNSDKLSPQKIADLLKEQGYLSPEASAVKNNKFQGASRKINSATFWRAEAVRGILSDDIYTGIRFYNKSKKGKKLPKSEWQESPYRHEAIIYQHIFELAQQRLKEFSDRKVTSAQKNEENLYLLRGLLKCDHCRKLTGQKDSEMMNWTGIRKFISDTNRHSYSYQCNRKNSKKFSVVCPVVPIPAEPIEEYVTNFVKQLLKSPQSVYDYQKELASNQLSIQNLEADKRQYEKMLNALPLRKQSVLEQHEMGGIDTPTLKVRLEELKEKEKLYKERISEIDYRLSRITLSRGYEESLKLYSERYGKSFESIMADKKQLFELIHSLIYQITVYSRTRTTEDVIAGKKKEGQMIPERIDIHLNLPQNLLRELYNQKFTVKSDDL